MTCPRVRHSSRCYLYIQLDRSEVFGKRTCSISTTQVYLLACFQCSCTEASPYVGTWWWFKLSVSTSALPAGSDIRQDPLSRGRRRARSRHRLFRTLNGMLPAMPSSSHILPCLRPPCPYFAPQDLLVFPTSRLVGHQVLRDLSLQLHPVQERVRRVMLVACLLLVLSLQR